MPSLVILGDEGTYLSYSCTFYMTADSALWKQDRVALLAEKVKGEDIINTFRLVEE